MTKVYLIHGWEGHNKNYWFPWLKTELEKKKIEVVSLSMPNPAVPKIEEWVGYLKKAIDSVDEHTYFVGHSTGCQTIMRYLEKLHKHIRIAGCCFVAPFLDLMNLSPEEMIIAHPWINSKIDTSRILDHTNNFLCIFSNDDPYIHLDQAEKFKEQLDAKIIIKKNKGHFTGDEKIPEVLKFIKH